jgi:hypothetical protein
MLLTWKDNGVKRGSTIPIYLLSSFARLSVASPFLSKTVQGIRERNPTRILAPSAHGRESYSHPLRPCPSETASSLQPSAVFFFRHGNEMDMIWHQTRAPNRDVELSAPPGHKGQVRLIVFIAEKASIRRFPR